MTIDTLPTAAAAGFHMPAEWETHERCWMAWPCRAETWADNIGATRRCYADVANAIAEFEPVTMLALASDVEQARNLCSVNVSILAADIDDSWMRDMGPNFVRNDSGEIAASLFHFNAWGKKYPTWGKDAAIGHRVAEFIGLRTFTSSIFMEGGGIDGDGTLLTTDQCVLNDNRNPGLARSEAEQVFGASLGVSNVLWMPGDPEDTETTAIWMASPVSWRPRKCWSRFARPGGQNDMTTCRPTWPLYRERPMPKTEASKSS
jgi:agmatine deiminase